MPMTEVKYPPKGQIDFYDTPEGFSYNMFVELPRPLYVTLNPNNNNSWILNVQRKIVTTTPKSKMLIYAASLRSAANHLNDWASLIENLEKEHNHANEN